MGRPAKNKPAETKQSTSEVKSDDLIVEVTSPSLEQIVIKVSKKRNIVVNKQADNKQIKETWLGTELEFTYRIPKNMSLPEQLAFVDDQIPIAKRKADDYFISKSDVQTD